MSIGVYMAAIVLPAALFAQDKPRGTSIEAAPDISGVWNYATLTPLERPARFASKPFLSTEEAAAFEKDILRVGDQALGTGPAVEDLWLERGHLAIVNGRYITSLISDPPDGHIPEPTEAARARMANRAQAWVRADGPEDRWLSERCLRSASGPPIFPSADANIVQIVQSRDDVVILMEKFHDARIVPLDPHPRKAGAPRSWMGDSHGHWEGNTLVVDTSNFTDKIGLTGRFDENLHLVERFTRTDSNTLLYEVRIEDSTAFVRPWSVTVPWVRTTEPLLEFACHEGNYALPNILRAARAAERSGDPGPKR